ncbi:hypothetical protein QTP88_025045 [Uroleucon formosanum]
MSTKTVPFKMAACKCKYNCRRFTEVEVRTLHSEFWKQTPDNQGNFLYGLINITAVKQRRPRKEDVVSKKRQVSVTYCLPKSNEGHVQDVELIKAHVRSFPTEESHYSRRKTSKLFLSPDLNIHRLYRAFKITHPDTNIDQRFYRRVFKKSFPKLSFHRPRADTCATCDRLTNKINFEESINKFKITAEKELHLRKAEKATQLLNDDNTKSQMPSSQTCTVSMDMQQVIFTPTLTHSNMFYSRQLSNYNLCIHIGDTGKSIMCMWHEGIAGRGGNEIASCLLNAITSGMTTKKKLQIWCDNCAGQNKNRVILIVLIYAIAKKYFDTIDLKFLVSGHSYMPCDRDFGIIEKRKKVCSTMVPEEVASMVRDAKHFQPFNVVMMTSDDFYDFAKEADTFLNTAPIKISNLSWIRISRDDFPMIKTRQTFNTLEPWKSHNIFKKRHSFKSVERIQALSASKKETAISEPKKKDLLAMLDFLDEKYHAFYRDVCK